VRYNRKLRSRRTIRSDLGDIPGIGPRRQTVLLRRFGSLQGVKEASKEEIARVPGFSEALASRILTYLGR
jgi:excinuclease ABC subunit C